MNVNTPAPTHLRSSPVKLESGSSHLCPRKTLKCLLYMILSIGFLLLIDSQRVLNTFDITISSFEKSSTDVRENSHLRRAKQIVGVEGSNEGDGDEPQLPAELETTVGTSDVHIIIIIFIMICVLCDQLLSSHIQNLYIS